MQKPLQLLNSIVTASSAILLGIGYFFYSISLEDMLFLIWINLVCLIYNKLDK